MIGEDRRGRISGPAGRDCCLLTLAGVVMLLAYTLTHSYPAGRGGLYLVMARQLAAHGFLPPATVTGYVAVPLPFAYPPLGIYVMALPLALGLPGLAVLEVLPGICFLLASLAVYAFVSDYTHDRRAGLVAGLLTLACPQILLQSIVGAGVTRSLGLLFVAVGLLLCWRVFTVDRFDRRRTVLAGVVFGLLVLTHYIYALLFVIAVLTIFVTHRRTPSGFARGCLIAAVGFVVTSPWLVHVSHVHGPATLLAPRTSYHGGLSPVPVAAVRRLLQMPVSPVGYLYVVLAGVGTASELRRRRFALPAIAAVYTLVYPHVSSQFALFAMLAGIGVAAVANRERTTVSTARLDGPVLQVLLAALVVSAFGLGLLFVTAPSDESPVGSIATPLDSESVALMNWARTNTAANATFLVTTYASEWFPAIAHRPLAVAPWGAEWFPPDRRHYFTRTYASAKACDTPDCFSAVVAEMEHPPDYLVAALDPAERAAFEQSPRYDVRYTDGALTVVALTRPSQSTNRSSVRSIPATHT